MVVRHHQLNGHEFEETLGYSEGQRSLACCSPCGHKESDTTERLSTSNSLEQQDWVKHLPMCFFASVSSEK